MDGILVSVELLFQVERWMPFSPGAVLLLRDLDDRILADMVLLF